jgi:uncharacterized protein
MKRLTLIVGFCLLLVNISVAQQATTDSPASKEDIERYLATMHSRELMMNMMGAMTKQMHQILHEQLQKTPNLPPDFEAKQEKMIDEMLKDFPVDDLLQAMVPVYEKHMTKGDVDALVAFYSTPRGQKILKEMPAMTAEAMQASSGIIKNMMTKAMQRVQDEIAQFQKANDPQKPN